LPAPEELLRFRLPEVEDVEIYLVRTPDGRVVARTADELEELAQEAEEGGEETPSVAGGQR